VREKSIAAVQLLTLSAFFAPEAIPHELILEGATALDEPLASELANWEKDKTPFRQVLSRLADYSLIRRNVAAQTYDVHRLMQEVIQVQMDDATLQTTAERAVRVASHAFPIVAFINWPFCDRLLPHALQLATKIEQHSMEFEEATRLLNEIGVYLTSRALYSIAEPLYLEALGIRRKALPKDHPDIAGSLNNLALLYQREGLYEKAELLHVEALEIWRKTLPEGHPNIAASLNNLASLYQREGLYKKAEPLFEEALRIRRKALSEDHPDIAQSLNNLAGLYQSQCRYHEAEALFTEAGEIWGKVLTKGHPDTAIVPNRLAGLYQLQGLYSQAEPLYLKALGIWSKSLGVKHPNTQKVLQNFVNMLTEQGRNEDAEALKRQYTIPEAPG